MGRNIVVWIKPVPGADDDVFVCYVYMPGGRNAESDELVEQLLETFGWGVTRESSLIPGESRSEVCGRG